jgi:argininosuccinate synthase
VEDWTAPTFSLCLSETGFTRVIALCVDVGEGIELAQLDNTARRFNAELVVQDARDTFANDYVRPALKAQAKYLDIFPVSSSLARPLIARQAVQAAADSGAIAVLHTANQSQNSLRRLNSSIIAEGFNGLFGSPYEYSALSRSDKAESLSRYGLSFYAGRKLSGDANIWCREFESGPLS